MRRGGGVRRARGGEVADDQYSRDKKMEAEAEGPARKDGGMIKVREHQRRRVGGAV